MLNSSAGRFHNSDFGCFFCRLPYFRTSDTSLFLTKACRSVKPRAPPFTLQFTDYQHDNSAVMNMLTSLSFLCRSVNICLSFIDAIILPLLFIVLLLLVLVTICRHASLTDRNTLINASLGELVVVRTSQSVLTQT